jgi:hypothetical protein
MAELNLAGSSTDGSWPDCSNHTGFFAGVSRRSKYATKATALPNREELAQRFGVALDSDCSWVPAPRAAPKMGSQVRCGVFSGRYWARTSDLRLVEAALSQLS